MSGIIIRDAILSDCEDLVVLMLESAKERLMEIDLKTRLQDLKDGFRDSSIFRIYVSQTEEGNIVGYLLFYFGFSTLPGRTICAEDLYVIPAYRRKGIASSLWKKLIQTALQNGCCRCDVFALPEDPFLLSQGAIDATVTEHILCFKFDKEAVETIAGSCKSLEGIVIRKGKKSDCKTVMKLVEDLNKYENNPGASDITASDLENDGYGDQPWYRCYVAEANGTLVGYTTFFFTYKTDGLSVFMEDIFVSAEFRKKGVGVALMSRLMKECHDNGGKCCYFSCLDFNTPSISFYKHVGAVDISQEKSCHIYEMNKEAMEKYIKAL